MKFEKIGEFSPQVVKTLSLDIPAGTEIFLSEYSFVHIESAHPEAFKYIDMVAEIVKNPDFVRYSHKKNTVDFIHISGDNTLRLRVPVRPSSDGIHFVRSLFMLHEKDFNRLKRNNSILPVDKHKKVCYNNSSH